MDFNSFYDSYKKKRKQTLPADYAERVESCLSTQVHTSGARPSFDSGKQYGKITSGSSNRKYDKIFATRLLNRHPNENDAHYNWRLSVFAPIAKELYDRFLTMCRGTILQPNSYVVSLDDKTADYIDHTYIHDLLYHGIAFTLENPYAYMAVIEGDTRDKESTEEIKPEIVYIPIEDLLMLDDESCAFRIGKKIFFLDANIQVVIEDKQTYETTHNFGERPFWEINNNFIEPFVSWADLLVRNMNDDEAMTKQYSYPIKQLVLPRCNAIGCVNGIVVDNTDINNPTRTHCSSCHGTGTMSMNPGDNYTISEETFYKANGNMYDMAKFITPDVGIPKYHLDRWQIFYDRTEKSLNLNKKINATESGEAKREDRKDQYFYLMTISNFVFAQLDKGLQLISSYLNYNQSTSSFEQQEVVLIPPKQFDLMTDADLISEFTDLQNRTDDTMLLAELQFAVNRRIYRNDDVQLKINEILYYNDPLYGISGNALKSKLLSGVFTDFDKTIHEKGYKLLLNISNKMGVEAFVDATMATLVNELNSVVAKQVPKGIYAPDDQL